MRVPQTRDDIIKLVLKYKLKCGYNNSVSNHGQFIINIPFKKLICYEIMQIFSSYTNYGCSTEKCWIFTSDENRPDQSNRATILIISLRTVVLDDADPFRKVDYWHGKHRAP